MFPWQSVALGFTALTGGFDLYLCQRQLRRYVEDKEVPAKLKGLITAEQFASSCHYQRDSMRFSIFQSVVELVIAIASISLGLYPYLWRLVESWVGFEANEYTKSLCYLGLVMLIGEVYSIPFSLYSDFVIEERHGFNKKTLGLFVTDMLKSLALMSLIGAPVIAVVINLVRWAGPNCYLYLWAFSMTFMLLMTFIVPVLIMPLFNKYEPVADQELKKNIEDLAERVKYPLTKLYQMDGSKRSNHSNAFMYGFWKNKRIVLFDTLLKQDNKEIVAVIAHELGHWAHSHMMRTLALGSVVLFVQLYLFRSVVFNAEPFQSFGFDTDAVVIGLFIFSLILQPANVILGIATTYMSRCHEFQADKYGKDLGYGQELAQALLHLGIENKSTYNPDPLYAACKYSHPTLTERLTALEFNKKKD